MKNAFVKTQNYHAFNNALKGMASRGAEECQLIVVDGKPGLGKTTILRKWAAENSCLYLRAKTEWSPSWFIGELLDEVRTNKPVRHADRFNASLQTLVERSMLADQMGRQFAVVIDEADHVSSRQKVIETMRDLADLAEVPFILIGMGRIRDNLTRFPQIASRVSGYVHFGQADLSDVELFLSTLCEVPVARDLAEFVLKATGGYNREIKEAIRAIEQFGRRTPPQNTDHGLTLREMAGEHLINDRSTGMPICVPGIAA